MEENFISVFNFFIAAYNSQVFVVLKFILGIYLIVLIIDIILLFVARGVGANIRYLMHGENIPTDLTSKRKKTRNKWDVLRRGLESESEDDWKVMIIKADDVIYKLFHQLGYPGANLGELLENVEPGHFEDIEGIKVAHEMRNKIIHDDKFVLSKDEAKETMDNFEALFKFFDV